MTDANRRAWQRQVGYVPQFIHLVDDTVLANIARGVRPGRMDRAAAIEAARIAQLEDVVAELPDGYDTRIGEGGMRLSGGQRQRLGIARALYRDPDLLILDEATSALDAVTEGRVLAAIHARDEGKTVVMITHRLQSLVACDWICFLQDGQVTARGDFETLRHDVPLFRAMLEAAQ
ncbi:ABC transporter-like protein [Oceaniovalibus guishaninsula JLT2003]|uniref:ABC transporter-like protein n=1 Tax=Oceaniovalibus guishaninsula JLT2003 TaxID=1231392 RepID=K2H6U2_9RHOB|nr:ABC transporter-like protein [Oceaniovalibus guishaninsula JLT2003]